MGKRKDKEEDSGNNTPLSLASVEEIIEELSHRDLQFFMVVNYLEGSMKDSTMHGFAIKTDPDKLLGSVEYTKSQLTFAMMQGYYSDDEEDDCEEVW